MAAFCERRAQHQVAAGIADNGELRQNEHLNAVRFRAANDRDDRVRIVSQLATCISGVPEATLTNPSFMLLPSPIGFSVSWTLGPVFARNRRRRLLYAVFVRNYDTQLLYAKPRYMSIPRGAFPGCPGEGSVHI
jgi:hypothetical protein